MKFVLEMKSKIPQCKQTQNNNVNKHKIIERKLLKSPTKLENVGLHQEIKKPIESRERKLNRRA